ncbi:hypothetical protein HPC49_20335 [Pyxidicoccus fallax]|uniref:Uncharacterized protein n=1 Tax=Pyxidicoccus fallax TaxID=394095 RepID=A0A848LQJ5_9BACT|nr:hypothetical protein [Pyxidicoccus fallax]NMO19949.1 hypothetical protein [Pyxidicoccus fallax]NPC80561.1 hypothetical protein [Pyxidicoccus fallax]
MEIPFDRINREERAACAHLFRLLHEGLATAPQASAMARVLAVLHERGLDVPTEAAGAVVLTEVALIRDAYESWKDSDVSSRMDDLVGLVAEGRPHTRWSQLAPVLRDPRQTHPAQVRSKADRLSIGVGPEGTLPGSPLDVQNRTVYGTLQGVFNAKPDLALVLPSRLIVFEAKLTEAFDNEQFERTRLLARLWASPLLHGYLGFSSQPPVSVEKLGDEGTGATLTWQDLLRIAAERYPPNDRTYIALRTVVDLLAARRRPTRLPAGSVRPSAGESPRGSHEMGITRAALLDAKARVAERLRTDTAFEDGKVESLDRWMEPLPPTAEAWVRELRRCNAEPWAFHAAAWLLREAAPAPGPTEIVSGDMEVGRDEVRVIPGGLRVEGHLSIVGTLLVLGDAEVTGLVRDSDPDSRVAIAGSLRCGSLVTDGAFFVGGDLVAKDLIHGFHNDKSLMVSGGIRARLFLGEDHDIRFGGDLETELGSDEDFFRNDELLTRVRQWLVDEVVDANGLRRDALIACLRDGRSIFRRK